MIKKKLSLGFFIEIAYKARWCNLEHRSDSVNRPNSGKSTLSAKRRLQSQPKNIKTGNLVFPFEVFWAELNVSFDNV